MNTYQNTHLIMLDWNSYGVRLDETGMSRLITLVQECQVCAGCYNHFTVDNPNVSGNYCLRCFQANGHKGYGLIFQGELPREPERFPRLTDTLRKSYWFLNREGIVYTSQGGPGYSRDMESDRSNVLTLQHWGFPLPTTVEWNGETLDLPAGRLWSFFGNVQQDAVLILHYILNHDSKTIDLYFFSQRSGLTMHINKRKPLHRRLYEEARAALPNHPSEWDIYDYMAKRLSEELQAVQPSLLESA